MKGHRTILLVICLALVCPMLPVGLSGNALALDVSSHVIGSSGSSLTLDGTVLHLEGVNDQTVIPLQFYPYPTYHYLYSNHLFSSVTGRYTGDTTTILNSDNMTDFWWQYFYLVNSLGLNCVRLGGFNAWGLNWLYHTYHTDRALFDSVIDPMFMMAELNHVYLVFDFGSGGNDCTFDTTAYQYGTNTTLAHPLAGSCYQIGSACYNEWLSFMGAVMIHYQNRSSLAMWETNNEPDSDGNFVNYWSHFSRPKEAYRSWAENLTKDLNAIDHHHLLTIGAGVGGLMFCMNADTKLANDNSADICQSHVYGETRVGHGYGCAYGEIEDESSFVAGRVEASALGKPAFFGEAGYASVSPPWVIRYWPFLHDICAKCDINLCWLNLLTCPGYPIPQDRLANIPGIPAEPINHSPTQDGDFIYETFGSSDVATIIGYAGAAGALIIPSTLGRYATVAIGNYAFASCTSLTSIAISNGVVSIGDNAFASCTSLISMVIPSSVTSIGSDAFHSCISLTSISVAESNLNYASVDGILFNKVLTTLIQCPGGKVGALTISSGVTSIGSYAFQSCTALTNVIIPNSLTSIATGAFMGCTALASISIGSGVTWIGDGAFAYCSALISVTVPDSVTHLGSDVFSSCTSLTAISVGSSNPNYASDNGVLYDKTLTTLIQCPGGQAGSFTVPSSVKSIGREAFSSCSSITYVSIPNSVTSIGYYAFSCCAALISVTLPDTITSIGYYWFASCPSLTTVIIPSAVTSIMDGSFSGCTAMASVIIPAGVTSIGNFAFQSCTSLTTINIDSGNPNYASINGVLYNHVLTTLIQCPGGKVGALETPSSVTSIGNYAFAYCNALLSVTIASRITSIGFGAFFHCVSLTAINVNANNQNYARVDGVLYNKSIIKLITYPGGRIGTFSVPNNVTIIGDYSFQWCTAIASLVIPSSVDSIGGLAFQHCTSLSSIIFHEHTAPTYIGIGWILGANVGIIGHAYASSNFPVPGRIFYGLKMGEVIPTEIIIDDVSATFVGTWPTSTSVSGYYNIGYHTHAAGTGANTATWGFTIPTAGSWQVYARWTGYSNRATNAQYTVNSVGGASAVIVNQRINSGTWMLLGTYSFNVAGYSVVLSDKANGYVIADAIRLVSTAAPIQYMLTVNVVGSGSVAKSPNLALYSSGTVVTLTAIPAAGFVFTGWSGALTGTTNPATITMSGNRVVTATFSAVIIVDDVSAKFVGTWLTSTSIAGYNGVGYHTHTAGTGTNTVTWGFTIPTAGSWQVYARWTGYSNRATNAKYTVNSAGGASTVIVNQQINGRTWVLLGTYNFNAAGYSVLLSDNANGYVIADAIRLVYV